MTVSKINYIQKRNCMSWVAVLLFALARPSRFLGVAYRDSVPFACSRNTTLP